MLLKQSNYNSRNCELRLSIENSNTVFKINLNIMNEIIKQVRNFAALKTKLFWLTTMWLHNPVEHKVNQLKLSIYSLRQNNDASQNF